MENSLLGIMPGEVKNKTYEDVLAAGYEIGLYICRRGEEHLRTAPRPLSFDEIPLAYYHYPNLPAASGVPNIANFFSITTAPPHPLVLVCKQMRDETIGYPPPPSRDCMLRINYLPATSAALSSLFLDRSLLGRIYDRAWTRALSIWYDNQRRTGIQPPRSVTVDFGKLVTETLRMAEFPHFSPSARGFVSFIRMQGVEPLIDFKVSLPKPLEGKESMRFPMEETDECVHFVVSMVFPRWLAEREVTRVFSDKYKVLKEKYYPGHPLSHPLAALPLQLREMDVKKFLRAQL